MAKNKTEIHVTTVFDGELDATDVFVSLISQKYRKTNTKEYLAKKKDLKYNEDEVQKSQIRIDQEIEKTREKIAEYQEKLKTLETQKTEAENLEIVQMVRALRMTPAQLNAMLSGGIDRKSTRLNSSHPK